MFYLAAYCGMKIPLSDKHRFVRDNPKNALDIQDKIQSETKFNPRLLKHAVEWSITG